MKAKLLVGIARRLMKCPAAPYHEEQVQAEVERICREENLQCRRDACGNLIVRLQTTRRRALVLAAHLDHPGFEIINELKPGRWLARFLGGVGEKYFRKGVPLRLQPGGERARLDRQTGAKMEFEIVATGKPKQAPRFAVWDLEEFAVRGARIHGRVCDDLIGCAAILAAMIELKRFRARVNVIGVLARAEEVGFHGALTVAVSSQLPRNGLVVSLETSRELPPVEQGRGVIVRVGDRASVFDSAATRFITEVAAGNQAKDKRFLYQRALMSGGTCEGTAYQEYGFQTAAVCVALGNYHNCGANRRIAAEHVNLADAVGMANLMAAAARRMGDYPKMVGKLPIRLKGLLKEAKQRFRQAG
jgi:putative aminopeptidase FrvX